MKTWWDYLGLMIFLFLLPIIAGILPTFEKFDKFWGGGVVREYFINLLAGRLPDDKAAILVQKFNESGVGGEILLYLPIALNISLITLFIGYLIGFVSIEVNNFIRTNVYQSKRQKAKGN
jgi:hypothetical protein